MDPDLVGRVITSASRYGLKEIIPSTMGEPLLYPHFDKLLEAVKQLELKINITTNGTFPKLGAHKWGERLLPLVSDMKISINGASKTTNEYIMRGIAQERLLNNIQTILDIRDQIRRDGKQSPHVTFQVTYMKSNLAELEDLLRMAIRMDVDRFKGHHLWMTWPELKDESLTIKKADRTSWNRVAGRLQKIAERTMRPSQQKIRLDNVYTINEDDSTAILPLSWTCPFLGKEAWIAWDGRFNVCCAPDALRRKFGNLGNVRETDLMVLWNSPGYKRAVRSWKTRNVCQKCNMRKPQNDQRRS
jgi:MoaA/NifB/PqqE/SkfB family radical SAM enzyme